MGVLDILGYVIMGIGVLTMAFGVIGIFQKKKDFYYRILVVCKIDTVGMMTVVIGLAFRHGLSFFTAKLMFILIILLVLNPLVAHIVARAAYMSGYKSISEQNGDEQNDDEQRGLDK